MTQTIDFIVNPRASNGRCGRDWTQIIEPELAARGVRVRVHLTEHSGHGVDLARRLAESADTLVSVGGDGTHNEVVAGLVAAGVPRQTGSVGFLTLGTGGDFRKTLGLPVDPIVQISAILDDVRAGRGHRLDCGRLHYTDHEGQPAERGFVNIAGFGISGQVDAYVNTTTKAFGGLVSFFVATLRATLAWRNRRVRIRIDGEPLPEQAIYNVAVANGRWFGGGMMVAPMARPDDGLFDIVCLGDLTFAQTLGLTRHIYAGTHLALPKIWHRRGRVVEAESDTQVLLDVDGEPLGRLPARFEIVPEALRVVGMRDLPTDS